MSTPFDRITEGERERALMETIRGGGVDAAHVEDVSLPFFVKIQIQTASPCNARCVMCPWPQTAKTLPQGRMTEATFRRIVEQLPGRGVERTSLFLMNEPLVDPRLETFTAHLKETVPETTAVIFTNGALLDGARAEALAAAGMDEINVSVIGFRDETYRRVMGIDYARVRANLAAVRRLEVGGALGAMRIKIIALDLPGIRDGLDAFEADTGYRVFFKPVTNRAGNVETGSLAPDATTRDEPVACQRPFVKAYVLYNGDVVLCNCDWQRSTILGNVNEASLEDIWRGERLMEIRRHHVRTTFPEGSLCSGCDYPYQP